MKQTRRELSSVIKSLNALTQKVEKIIDKIEPAEKAQSKQKKNAVQKKPVKKPAKANKTVSTGRNAKKPFVKKTLKKSSETGAVQQISDSVLGIIQTTPEGVTTDQIIERTGLKKKQVWNIVSKAKREGKIEAAKRGIYTASKS